MLNRHRRGPIGRRLAVFAAVVGVLAASCASCASSGRGAEGPVGDPAAAHLATSNTTSAPACAEDGSDGARQCWQRHTGVLGFAIDHGQPWTQGSAHPDAQDPSTDPNLVTRCGTATQPVEIDLFATSTTVHGGTCQGPVLTGSGPLPIYGQVVHALIHGCVNVHVGGATLVDDAFIDRSPTCDTGGDGGNGSSRESGATIQTGTGSRSHFAPVHLLYVTVDGYGCDVVSAHQDCTDVYGVGGTDIWAQNVNVFGYAHDFEAFGPGPTTSTTDTSTNVRIADSMAPCSLCHTVLTGDPTDPYVHNEDVYLWNTSGVMLTHDWFSADAGTEADPRGSTANTSAAVFQNANTNLTSLASSYLDGGSGFNIEGNCPQGTNSNETFEDDALALAKNDGYGYPGTVAAWTPTTTGNVWGGRNHSADGTVASIPAPSPGGC